MWVGDDGFSPAALLAWIAELPGPIPQKANVTTSNKLQSRDFKLLLIFIRFLNSCDIIEILIPYSFISHILSSIGLLEIPLKY
jgi:hypothetical protein